MNGEEKNTAEVEMQNRTFLDQQKDNIIVITRGHPFERDPFFEMIDSTGYPWSHIEHPAAQEYISSGSVKNYKAIVFYDMPGINFETAPPKPTFIDPSKEFKEGFLSLLKKGIGCVFIHHAIAGWPNWEEYGNIIGGRFLYQEGNVRGVKKSDSGYRHDIKYKVIKDGKHPITEGIEDFEITAVFKNDEAQIEATNTFDLSLINGKSNISALKKATVGTLLNLKFKKLFKDEATASRILNISPEKTLEIKGEITIDIKEINERVMAEINQEFFDKIYGPNQVNSEEEMRQKVVEQMEKEWPEMTSEFKKIQREQYELFLHKQHDYGPGNISVGTMLQTPEEIKLSLTGLWFRMNDKLQRVKTLLMTGRESAVKDEPLEDAYLDVSNYGIMATIVGRGKWGK